jgi:zinc transport system permease protein
MPRNIPALTTGRKVRMLSYGFMQNALVVSLFIAVLCPSIGIFLVLRRYSMIGDTLSHASLAGITIGLIFEQNPVLGAFVFTSLAGALIEFLRSFFRKNTDLILSIVLALCVGTAITIISSGRLRANADSFLFGSVLTVTRFDMIMVIILSAVSVLALLLLYHQLVYIAYDEEAARIAGVKVRLLNYVFSVLVASAISVTIRIVGVLVISSMIALPVAAALQLGKGFKATLVFSVVFSVVDIMLGLVLSYYLGVAPGGFTALVSVAVLVLVILAKGISARVLKKAKTPKKQGV